jgi:hypothetical protein
MIGGYSMGEAVSAELLPAGFLALLRDAEGFVRIEGYISPKEDLESLVAALREYIEGLESG